MAWVRSRPGADGKPRWFVTWRAGGKRLTKRCRTQAEAKALGATKELAAHRARLEGRVPAMDATLAQFRPRLLRIWKARNLRQHTIDCRGPILDSAEAFFGTTTLAGLRRADIEAWIGSIPYSVATRRQYHAVLAAALEVAVETDVITVNPSRKVKLPKLDRVAPVAMTREQALALYAAVPEAIRVAVILYGEVGLRRNEALTLRWADVTADCSAITIRVEVSKGRHEDTLPLNALATKTLKDLRAARPGLPEALVCPVPVAALNRAVRAAADRLGLLKVSPKVLRDYFATQLDDAGIATRKIRDLLRHRNIATTDAYLKRADLASLREAVESAERVHALPPIAARTAATET